MAETQNSTEQAAEKLRLKVKQLYEFLKEANQIQFRPVRQLSDQPHVIRLADLPLHPSVQLLRPTRLDASQQDSDVLLRVSRPKLTRCPPPPDSCIDWLLPNWGNPDELPKVAESLNHVELVLDEDGNELSVTRTTRFEDDPLRATQFAAWLETYDHWAEPERAARRAMEVFEQFYALHAKIEKQGERLELLIGDGMLSWNAESAIDGKVQIRHPLLLKRVELSFNARIPEFTLHDTDRGVELYQTLFLDLRGVEASSIRNRKEELEASSYHPLGLEGTSAFLKALVLTISPLQGEYLERPAEGSDERPRIWREPVIFLRNRNAGISNALDKILKTIEHQTEFPAALQQITGEDKKYWPDSGIGHNGSEHDWSTEEDHATEKQRSDDDVLLVNDANDEQVQIVKRLRRSGSVVVQGPPGTGKTHTISNLIGHLLSQGKSILVTAHTVKALRVLRDKVPDMLKPLCVSVLGGDQVARRELESAISSITERLTTEDYYVLSRRAEIYEGQRRELLAQQLLLKHRLREAIESEYLNVEFEGAQYSPSDVAKEVVRTKDGNDWVPSPVLLGASIETKINGIHRLYQIGSLFDGAEEQDSRRILPKISEIPSESIFKAMVQEFEGLIAGNYTYGIDAWVGVGGTSEDLSALLDLLSSEFSDSLISQSWRPWAIVAGIQGEKERNVWQSLVEKINAATDSNVKNALLLHHKASLADSVSIQKQHEVLEQVCAHLEAGGKLGFLQLATRPEWRLVLKGLRVAAGQPTHIEHFRALNQLADLCSKRNDIEPLWNALIGCRANNSFDSLGPAPEQSCRALIVEIKRCLDWHEKVWVPLVAKLHSQGLKINELIEALPRQTSEVSAYADLERFATGKLPELLRHEMARRRLAELEAEFSGLIRKVLASCGDEKEHGCAALIVNAIRGKDVVSYVASIRYLQRLHDIKPLVEERELLLADLNKVAPSWAACLQVRTSAHEGPVAPGDIQKAWRWRQLADALEKREGLDAEEIQRELESVSANLRLRTTALVDAKAWSKQLQRLQADNFMRQALIGWADTARRLASTRQAEKRQTLLSEARKLMGKCGEAVPVWIMPITTMAESFDPNVTKFDVVIIDEASQADINALIPLYMGRQVIVVGDHEQVTPLGVGKDQTMLENLRKSMLRDIPNAHLYDNMSSIYDLARQSFGDAVRLVEHFRCVPQIISFSNALSYDGKIRPLREANSSNVRPACVPVRVDGVRHDDVNEAEARKIVALVNAMTQHPAYTGKTIGVISMLGESQAIHIQSLLHKHVDPKEMESRRIQAGISSEFQGDERDIVFLSLVDSAVDTNPLRATGDGAFEQTKKRYNVAASRARDQLLVVHSFDPDLHLKSADIRLRLLQHVRDPDSSSRIFENEVVRVESPFEKEVLRRLTMAGFKVRTQVEVGYFRIDLVVEGVQNRLAVECDGDRYHPIEKLADDMSRQAILERLGWKFVRIRGTTFYRDPDKAMSPVFKRLEELDIIPNSGVTAGVSDEAASLIAELEEIARQFEVGRELVESRFEEEEVPSATAAEEAPPDSTGEGVPTELVIVEKVRVGTQNDVGEVSLQGRAVGPLFSGLEVLTLNDYVHYSGPACRDPRDASQLEIAEGFLRIVAVEGPVQVKRVCDVYLRSCGVKRMGHELRDSLLRAISYLKNSGKVVSHRYRQEDDALREIVWAKGSEPEVCRRRGDRSLEEIPLGELARVAQIILASEGFAKGGNEHMRSILEAFELKRLTSNAEETLRSAISGDFLKFQI